MFDKLKQKKLDKYVAKRDAYLSKFKPYEERSIAEKIIVGCLYKIEFMGAYEREEIRHLAAIESALIMEEFLAYGKKFDEIKYPGETYKTMIIRLAYDYLKENK